MLRRGCHPMEEAEMAQLCASAGQVLWSSRHPLAKGFQAVPRETKLRGDLLGVLLFSAALNKLLR